MTEKKLKMIVNFFTIAATVILFALILCLIFQFINQAILNNKKDALQRELDSLNASIEYYIEQNELLEDDSFMEQYAREYYNYGAYGERRYIYE